MKVSTKGRYAIRVMLDLAMHNTGEYIPLKDVAKRQGLTVKYLEQIISMLTRAGMVISLRGNNGGYRLSRRPEEYTIGEILRITEGAFEIVPCQESVNACDRIEMCATVKFWSGLNDVITEYVDSWTLADLIEQDKHWDYYTI